VTGRARTAKRSLQFFRGGSKFQVYIGILALDPQQAEPSEELIFFGLSLCPEGLAIAQKTLYNFVERAIRLYEQGPGELCGSTRLGKYVKGWVRWPDSGLPSDAAAPQKFLVVGHPAQGDVAVLE
jgi:hypothetical protein